MPQVEKYGHVNVAIMHVLYFSSQLRCYARACTESYFELGYIRTTVTKCIRGKMTLYFRR